MDDEKTAYMRPGESEKNRDRRADGLMSTEDSVKANQASAERVPQRRATRAALGVLRSQRPTPEGKISDMSTKKLGQAFKDRRPI